MRMVALVLVASLMLMTPSEAILDLLLDKVITTDDAEPVVVSLSRPTRDDNYNNYYAFGGGSQGVGGVGGAGAGAGVGGVVGGVVGGAVGGVVGGVGGGSLTGFPTGGGGVVSGPINDNNNNNNNNNNNVIPAATVCPAVTLPVVSDVTRTHFSTEYVTIPQPVTKYVFSTLPYQKTLYVTRTIMTTVDSPVETGLCTTTKVNYDKQTLTVHQVTPVTRYLTHTDVMEDTRTATNTVTHTRTYTKVLTHTVAAYATVTVSTHTVTHYSTTLAYHTNTITSAYNIRTTSVTKVAYPMWVTTTDVTWVGVTVTKTINKTNHKTIWTTCGGYN